MRYSATYFSARLKMSLRVARAFLRDVRASAARLAAASSSRLRFLARSSGTTVDIVSVNGKRKSLARLRKKTLAGALPMPWRPFGKVWSFAPAVIISSASCTSLLIRIIRESLLLTTPPRPCVARVSVPVRARPRLLPVGLNTAPRHCIAW